MANYIVIPSGQVSDPPVETTSGAYYYKYSYSWTSKSASTVINLTDAKLRFDTSKKNNAYIFLSCIGQKSTPPEFGLITTPNNSGKWYIYTRDAGSKSIETQELVISPSSSSGNIYSYANKKITMRISLSGSNIIGQILEGSVVKYTHTINGAAAGIGETAAANTFLLGTSFCPDPATTSYGGRNAYLSHVYLQDGKLFSKINYTGTSTQWTPDASNSATYYALEYDTDYLSYNRFSNTDEEISIDYN